MTFSISGKIPALTAFQERNESVSAHNAAQQQMKKLSKQLAEERTKREKVRA